MSVAKKSRVRALKDVFDRVGFLRNNSDLASVVVGRGKVNGKMFKFYPNNFGLMAWLFDEVYDEVDFRDGYRNHAFPGVGGPGHFSYMGFRSMLNSKFELNGDATKRWDIVTLEYFVDPFDGSEEDAMKESEEDAFKRTESVDAMLYLGDSNSLASISVFCLDVNEGKFVDATRDTARVPPSYELFYHTLKK